MYNSGKTLKMWLQIFALSSTGFTPLGVDCLPLRHLSLIDGDAHVISFVTAALVLDHFIPAAPAVLGCRVHMWPGRAH